MSQTSAPNISNTIQKKKPVLGDDDYPGLAKSEIRNGRKVMTYVIPAPTKNTINEL